MAQYHGYIQVPHSSYDQWRNATLSNQYDVDYYPKSQPYQCWDYCALLYFQYGLRLITRPNGNGTAADCWNISRNANTKYPFIQVTGKENIKRGDMLVWNATTQYPTGHIGFADQDYNGTNRINVISQNVAGNYTVHLAEISLNNYLGAFRNKEWNATPAPTPTPPATSRRKGFPWAIAWANWDNFKN